MIERCHSEDENVFPRFPNGFLFIHDSFSQHLISLRFHKYRLKTFPTNFFPTKFSSCFNCHPFIWHKHFDYLANEIKQMNVCSTWCARLYFCFYALVMLEWFLMNERKLWQSRISSCACRSISSVFFYGAASAKNLQRKPDTHVCAHDAILNFSSFPFILRSMVL